MKRILQEMFENNEIKLMLKEKNIDFTRLIEHLCKIKQEVLYKWDLHGSEHSDKVSLFVFLLAEKYGVNDVELQILLDAAAYHDIGRISDAEDNLHGYTSALAIDKVINDEIYNKEPKNLGYLKALCDAHSVPDNRALSIFQNYCDDYQQEKMDYHVFEKMLKILKDADGLDRTRFGDNLKASLQANYLRLEYSKELIDFAYELNEKFRIKKCDLLYNKIYQQYFNDNNSNRDCLHGIGFNFFKIESILKNGILSEYAAYKKGVSINRNFNGNNKSLWISVVDPNMIDKRAKGYNSFVLQGISFYCFCPQIFSGVTSNSSINPKYTGEYEDEKFVFDQIPPQHIYAILVPKLMADKSLLELNYLSGSNNYGLIFNTVKDYINHIEINYNVHVNKDEINNLLKQYEDIVVSFESLSIAEQKQQSKKLFADTDLLKEKLNKIIASAMSKYYADMLKIDEQKVMVKDVVAYELIKSNINIKEIYDSEEVMIVLDNLQEDKVNNSSNVFHI